MKRLRAARAALQYNSVPRNPPSRVSSTTTGRARAEIIRRTSGEATATTGTQSSQEIHCQTR